MNKAFKERFSYDWIFYLLVVVISISGWMYGFRLYHLPRDFEKLDMFFAGEVIDYSFEEKVVDALKDDELVAFTISSSNPTDNTFSNKYDIVGLNNSDLVFVPISIANKTACNLTFIELSESYNQAFYTQQGVNYGIIIDNKIKDNLNNYFKFEDEDYVIMINGASVNCGTKTNNAYDFVKWMVGYEL